MTYEILGVGLLALIGGVMQLDMIKRWKYNWALQIVKLAVAWTYNEYVRHQKVGDKKLTDEQRKTARLTAVRKAKEMAAQHGLNLDSILGHDLIEMFVEIAVASAKKGTIYVD